MVDALPEYEDLAKRSVSHHAHPPPGHPRAPRSRILLDLQPLAAGSLASSPLARTK